MKQSSGMATSPVVIPATILVVALLVAFCFGPTAAAGGGGGRPSHSDDTDATIRLPSSSAGAGGRPWECCDWVTQDPEFRPPRWRCNDVVDRCSADCQQCEASASGDGAGFVCRDWVVSLFEPPVCTPRPWDCCDLAACTRDYIPYCRCSDKVESCPSNCKECELVESSDSDPPRYRCLDVFHGYPGPKCTPWVSKSN